jgi:hypothetical protein
VHRVERLEDALPGLERQIQEAAESVDELQCGSVLAGRIAATVVDSWTPTIVLVAEPVAPASLERLAVITVDRDRSTVAAVVVSDAPLSGWRLDVDEQRV